MRLANLRKFLARRLYLQRAIEDRGQPGSSEAQPVWMRAFAVSAANGVRVESRYSVTNEEIDSFIGQRVKVTLESGRIREGQLKRSEKDSRVLVRGFGYDVPRNVISKIEPLP